MRRKKVDKSEGRVLSLKSMFQKMSDKFGSATTLHLRIKKEKKNVDVAFSMNITIFFTMSLIVILILHASKC